MNGMFIFSKTPEFCTSKFMVVSGIIVEQILSPFTVVDDKTEHLAVDAAKTNIICFNTFINTIFQ